MRLGVPLHTALTLDSPMFPACSYSRHDVRTILYTPEGADVSSEKKRRTKKRFTNWLGGREKTSTAATASDTFMS
jgi:hypothetical protein